jgi:hypothetical protein
MLYDLVYNTSSFLFFEKNFNIGFKLDIENELHGTDKAQH